MWQSSNPALRNDHAFHQAMLGERSTSITLQGVANKTGLLVAIAIAAGAGAYSLVTTMPSLLWITWGATLVVGLGVGFIVFGKPAIAPYLAPVYAVVEGGFLGSLSRVLDDALVSMGYGAAGGVALQAFIITISILIAMLALYSFRILRPTQMFVSIVKVATLGIGITYAISIVLFLFTGANLPLLSLTSAFGSGWTPIIGIGINVFILGIASMWLIIDFKMIEDHVAAGGPKYLEWYCGFALLVTLAWIYYEAVKLAFRVAILLGGRD